MATATKAKPLTVEDAKERADQARTDYLDLRNRLRDGDTSVTRDAIEKARAEADYADDLLEGARAVERRAQEQARADWIEDFVVRVAEDVDSGNAEVAEKADALRAAAREFAETAAEANSARRALSVEWDDHRPEDVPPDPLHNRELPPDYVAAKPIRIHPYSGEFDVSRLSLGLVVEGIEQARKPTTREEVDRHRDLRQLAAAPLLQLRNAIDHADGTT